MSSERTFSQVFLIFCSIYCCFYLGSVNSEDLFVEEAGETDFIPIESEPEIRNKRESQADYNYSYTNDYDENTQDVGVEASGDYYDTEDDEDSYNEVTPIMPSRIVPTLVSPSFEEPEYGKVLPTSQIAPKKTKTPAFDVIKTALFDDSESEGSGLGYGPDNDFEQTSITTKIVPSKTLTEKLPTVESSPTYPPETTFPHEPVIVTTPLLPPASLPPALNLQPPIVQKKLQKHAVVAGRALKIQIPEDTFYDVNDGNTRKMRIDVQQENGTPLRVPWLKYDPSIQTIFALPFDENGIGRYTFNIVATNSRQQSVFDKLEIFVRQYPGARLINHQFNVEFSGKIKPGWEWHMLDKIRELYGDPTTKSNILVRKIGENPFVFSWTNDSLTQQSCPKSEIRSLFSKLVEGEDAAYKSKFGTPSSQLKTLLGSDILVKSVSMSFLGTCLRDETIPRNTDIDIDGTEDSVPVIRNPIDRINITAGELLRYKVPEDTCYDPEDGKTSQLNLNLLTTNRRELSPDAWLQFDEKNQEFVGIPLEEEVGREEYQLVCSDANGLSAIDGIEVIVLNRPFNERFGVEFSLQFAPNDYNTVGTVDGIMPNFGQPILRRDKKVGIVETLAKYFGDSDTTNIILRTFDADNGKVVWHNKSLALELCDSSHVLWVKNHLINSKGKVVKALIRQFQPYLKLVDANAVKVGNCLTGAVPPVPTHGSHPNDRTEAGDTIFHGIIPSADYLLTFIIPAVIITCMLILAILLACMLHKKRKAGKLNLFYSEALPPRVPVILQDDLFDEHELGGHGGANKQPVLLREDLTNGGPGRGGSLLRENEALLQQGRPIQIDPYGRGSLGRPTPAYQRRQL